MLLDGLKESRGGKQSGFLLQRTERTVSGKRTRCYKPQAAGEASLQLPIAGTGACDNS